VFNTRVITTAATRATIEATTKAIMYFKDLFYIICKMYKEYCSFIKIFVKNTLMLLLIAYGVTINPNVLRNLVLKNAALFQTATCFFKN
jgi:hypothetical protein